MVFTWNGIGRLNLTFDDDGNLINFRGQPVLLDSSIPQEKDVLELLEVYRQGVEEVNSKIIGKSLVELDGKDTSCRRTECNYGNLITDAFVLYVATFYPSDTIWTNTPIGLYNGGGIRTSLNPGPSKNISIGDIMGTFPYSKQIVILTLSGKTLLKTLETGIRNNGDTSAGEFLQVSGLKVVYDRSKPKWSRVVSVKVRCSTCSIPTYTDLDLNKNYTIVTNQFVADGNDGYELLVNEAFNKFSDDTSEIDVMIWYFNNYSPVFAEVQGRISFINEKYFYINQPKTNPKLPLYYEVDPNGAASVKTRNYYLIIFTLTLLVNNLIK